MEAIGILILIAIAIFCAWVLTMVRRFAQAAKDDDVEEEEMSKAGLAPDPAKLVTMYKPSALGATVTDFEEELSNDEKVEWIRKEAHRWALDIVMGRGNALTSSFVRLACNDAEWALFEQYYEERKRELTIIAEGKTLWLLTNTASYGTEVTVASIHTIMSHQHRVFCHGKHGRRYWVKPEQLSPFSPRELYDKDWNPFSCFDAIVYWPDTPYHGREVFIREYNDDYLFTDCGLMLTHAMIRFPRHKFPIMRIEDETETGISTIEK